MKNPLFRHSEIPPSIFLDSRSEGKVSTTGGRDKKGEEDDNGYNEMERYKEEKSLTKWKGNEKE